MATVEDIKRIIAYKKRRLEHLAKPNIWISYTKNMECGELREFKQSCIDDEIIIEALERQIPTKPIAKHKKEYCTACGYLIEPPCEHYCSHCGQAICFE